MAGSTALYYPNIKLPGEDWLKSNLLMFDQIQRIKPEGYQDHSPFVTQYEDSGLVETAAILSYGYYRGQDEFLTRIGALVDTRPDVHKLLKYKEYLKSGAECEPISVHEGKLGGPITNILKSAEILSPEPDENGFYHMHPAVGEALMSSIAIACAKEEGLSIVTENGQLHSWLANLSTREAFDTLLSDDYVLRSGDINLERGQWGENCASIMLFSSADTSQLTIEDLKELQGEHEAIEKLRNRVAKLSDDIRIIGDPKKQEEAMRDMASKVLKQWQQDSKNMSQSWQNFFNTDLGAPADKFFETCVAGVYGSLAGGSLGATAGNGSFITSSTFIGAGLGFGIGLIVHAARSYREAAAREENSAYQFLTKCQNNGVVLVVD